MIFAKSLKEASSVAKVDMNQLLDLEGPHTQSQYEI